jgi:hypothetical protein
MPHKAWAGAVLLGLSSLTATAQAPIGSDVGSLRWTFDGWWYGEVLFESGATGLPEDMRNRVAQVLDRPGQLDEPYKSWCPFALVWIVGHADRKEGVSKLTQKLSQQRADYVAALASRYGLSERQRVCAEHVGADQPRSYESAKNRRVEFEVVCRRAMPSENSCRR